MRTFEQKVLAYVAAQKILYGTETRSSDISFLSPASADAYLTSLEVLGFVSGRPEPGYVDSLGKSHSSGERIYGPTILGLTELWSR